MSANGENGHALKKQRTEMSRPAQDFVKVEGAVAARVNNEVVPLSHPVVESQQGKVEPVPLASTDGIRTLVESLKFMLKIAKCRCLPQLALTVGKPIGAAYFCVLEEAATGAVHIPTEEELAKLKAAMDGLVDEGLPFVHQTLPTADVVANMSKTGAGLTASIIKDTNRPQIEVVECDGHFHIPQTPIVPSTKSVPKEGFRLSPFKEGFYLEHYRYESKTGELKHSKYDAKSMDLLYNEYIERRRWTVDVDLFNVAQLNTAVRNGEAKKVIQAVEANCDRQFVELAAQVKARSNVKVVLIAGPSSSGKTTFAKRLCVQLESHGMKPEVLSVDNFYKAWQDITPEGPQKVDWESLDSLNLQQLNDVLLSLMAGKKTTIPEYDMKTSMPADKSHWTSMQLCPRRGVIIMEGIHCLNPALTASVPRDQKFNIAIAPIPALQLDAMHILSGTTIRLLRRMIRDYLNRGRPVLATLRQWPSVAAGEINNIYPNQCHADAVMNSEIAYEMSVLKVHVEPLLRTVKHTEPEYSEVRRLLKALDHFVALPTNIIPPQSLLREFIGGSWYYDYGGWYKNY